MAVGNAALMADCALRAMVGDGINDALEEGVKVPHRLLQRHPDHQKDQKSCKKHQCTHCRLAFFVRFTQ